MRIGVRGFNYFTTFLGHLLVLVQCSGMDVISFPKRNQCRFRHEHTQKYDQGSKAQTEGFYDLMTRNVIASQLTETTFFQSINMALASCSPQAVNFLALGMVH